MNLPMVLFLLFGVAFGVFSWPHRHLFSEGPSRRSGRADQDGTRARLSWILQCAALWPLLAATGLHSIWLLAQRRRADARRLRDAGGS